MSTRNCNNTIGIVITEFIDYNVVAQILADAANRALGSVINKYKKNSGLMTLITKTNLFLNHRFL